MGSVNINIGNGNLSGLIQTADGVTGVVMTGVTEGGGYTLGTPILVTSMTDVANAGITVANNPFAIKQLQEFYNQAGTPAQIYVMLVANSMTVALMASNSNANGAVALLNYAQGTIKVLGLLSNDTVVYNAISTTTLNVGGTGYAVNDTFNVVNATSGATLATGKVTAVAAGVVTTFSILTNGQGYAVGTAVATVATSGVGTGLKLNITAITGATITNGLNADVYTAVTNMAVTAAAYVALEQPFRCVIGATSYSGTASSLTNMGMGTTNNRTALLLGDTVSGNSACVGLLLGCVSAEPVQRKISRVANGALTATNPYVGNVTCQTTGAGTMNVIAGKGFITFTMYMNTAGWFFSEDVMCTASTDDYYYLARGRVIDKAHIITYTTYVQSVDDEIPINLDGSGTMTSGYVASLQQKIIDNLNLNMTAQNNCSGVSCFIDPTQNVVSTNVVNIVIGITPVAYAEEINVTLGFEM